MPDRLGLTTGVLVVDAANVVGSRPDGWWRDRAGAAQRLMDRVSASVRAGRVTPPVVVVLEGRARDAGDPEDGQGIRVVRAPASGDDAITEVVARAAGEGLTIIVVTADRALIERVRQMGAEVQSPGRFLEAL